MGRSDRNAGLASGGSVLQHMAAPRLAVLASGAGTLVEAMLAAGVDVGIIAVDRPCRAVEVAAAAGIQCLMVERTDFTKTFDRGGYTAALTARLANDGVDVVAMAGFGTIAPGLVDAYPGRVLNTHPALLPAFKGWHAVRDALERGVKVTGCTVHVVEREVDEGRILAQEAVPVLANDDEATLHERIKVVERRLYPATIVDFCGSLGLDHRR